MIRALICDDEPLAVRKLEQLLAQEDGVFVAGATQDSLAVRDIVATIRPDLLFLDIEMPGHDGFDVVEEIARLGGPSPLIVFVTGYPEFAALAYETGAIDFLIKPLVRARLAKTLGRVRKALEDRSAQVRLEELTRQLDGLRATGGGGEPPQIWVRHRNQLLRIPAEEIDWVRADGEYVLIVVGAQTYAHRQSLTEFERALDPALFLRIHRSLLINRTRIQAVKRRMSGSYRVVATDGTDLPVGRTYRGVIKQLFKTPSKHETAR